MASNAVASASQTAAPRARIVSDGSPAELAVGEQPVQIGSAADNDIILDDAAAAPHHLSMQFRHRCWLLRVQPGCERVYVNARPVRELALLRLGDGISVGACKLLLLSAVRRTGDEDGLTADAVAGFDSAQTGLRCVAGPLSGQILRVQPDLLLDAGRLSGVSGCLRLQAIAGGARYERVADASPLPCRNGESLARGVLADGDQLSWGRHRFVVESTTSLAYPEPVNPDRPASADPVQPDAEDTQRSELAWLLGVAAVLAGVIALLLLLRP